MKKTVVFDAGGPHGKNNLLFRRDVVKERHGMPMCHLYEACAARGIELMTPDLYYALDPKPARAILVRNNTIVTEAKRLMGMGVHPAVLLGFEHPLYACEFYWNLERHTRDYDHTFMPTGARTIVSKKTIFHPWVSPQPYSSSDRVTSNFGRKKFLTMISGNGRINPLKRVYATVMNTIRPIPTLVNRELYIDRLEAVKHFAHASDFDFYGRGWNTPVRYTFGRYADAIARSWRGTIEDKLPVLQTYKFSLCFENAVFNGWITEKIIDCLFAGCVPVYWGAPDITDFIPADAFIDFRNFKNFIELEKFLRGMDGKTYQRHIDAINDWIPKGSRPFSQEQFTEDMIGIFESYF